MRRPAKSELAWVLADYEAAGEEAPLRVQQQPESCEGELMSEEEIEAFIYDGMMALRVMEQAGAKRYDEVKDIFLTDLQFLVVIGRLEQDVYNELIKEENYRL